MNFKDIKINTSNEYNTFIFNNQEVKVLKYLPIEDKFDLIMIALQKSIVEGIYNPIRLKVFFALNIVYLYTDIQFDVEERVNEGALYDNLEVSGFLSAMRDAMDPVEMLVLHDLFAECLQTEKEYRATAAAIISKLVDDLPKNADAAKEIVETFDKEKYAEVMNFAKAINNGKLG